MSLVRICTVTMAMLRLFLCICSRARYKERRRREITRREDTDEEQAYASVIIAESKESIVPQVKREIRLHPFLSIKNLVFFALALPKAISMTNLGPIVGNLTPHEAILDPVTRHAWQDRRFHQICKRWLLRMWRRRRFCQQDVENLERVQTVVCHQVFNSQIHSERKDSCEIREEKQATPTITWVAPPESFHLEKPSCSYRQEENSIKRSEGFRELERTLKTLLDSFLAKDEAGTFSYNECLAYFGDTCPCRFMLPNQIVGLDLSFRAASPLAPTQPAPPCP